jgi:hypothetical protein
MKKKDEEKRVFITYFITFYLFISNTNTREQDNLFKIFDCICINTV